MTVIVLNAILSTTAPAVVGINKEIGARVVCVRSIKVYLLRCRGGRNRENDVADSEIKDVCPMLFVKFDKLTML